MSTYNKTKNQRKEAKTTQKEVQPIDENIEEDEDISNRQDIDIDLNDITANDDDYGSVKKQIPKKEPKTE